MALNGSEGKDQQVSSRPYTTLSQLPEDATPADFARVYATLVAAYYEQIKKCEENAAKTADLLQIVNGRLQSIEARRHGRVDWWVVLLAVILLLVLVCQLTLFFLGRR